ncbi:phosphotransferase [Phytoactinopolyspora halotolerans]|uniref:Aminoglycoside phosphotransferase family protein n=1 Tax=Phytoactinopolyspora halotolerans TaxID=1981512 RepID=A0A6L9S9Y8_9ACTN|nr:aminoglycoside phosphotransferase family protein [Phytoactinopolyspora halotolerans]NEE00770.1 aminoglycoside phosphotransferase family protein [Phytoactinopolyspora halotolerans]
MPPLLASGRDADVYAIAPGRVLRRNRDGSSPAAEAEVMAHVRAHGFPAPRVFRVDGADLELERLDGPTMLTVLLGGTLDADDAAAILVDLHRQLHALPPMPTGSRPQPGAADRLDMAYPQGRIDPDGCVVHLDLHPQNVLLTGRGPVLIDWTNARHGPGDLDTALTALILGQAASGNLGPIPGLDLGALAAAALDVLTSFLAQVDGDPGRLLDRVVAYRAADPNIHATESDGLDEAASLVRAHLPR